MKAWVVTVGGRCPHQVGNTVVELDDDPEPSPATRGRCPGLHPLEEAPESEHDQESIESDKARPSDSWPDFIEPLGGRKHLEELERVLFEGMKGLQQNER